MSSAPDRLYKLLPAVFRVRDSALGEPLRALLALMQGELDAIDADIAGLYENWFIETCEEWVVPYIGDLLGTRGLKPIAGGTFTARPYVAHTLRYRRSKGTAAMLEILARDVTNWTARVVEFFGLLQTAQYLNHLRPENAATPDFRDTNALELLGSPFEQAGRTMEVRSADQAGRYNIPNLGIYLWRLESFPITLGSARPVTDGSDGRYRFHPLGIDAPLFNLPPALVEGERVTSEAQVPAALRRRTLFDELEARRQALADNVPAPGAVYFGANPVLQVVVGGIPVPPEKLLICDLSDLPSPAGSWPQPPATVPYTPSAGGSPVPEPITVSVDPRLGRLFFTAGSIPANAAQVLVNYSYGFSGNLGGGPYDRTDSMPQFAAPPTFQVAVTKQLPADNKTTFATLTDAIVTPAAGWNAQAAGTTGVIAILDSESYLDSPAITIPAGSTLLIVAADWPGLRQGNPTQKALEPANVRPHIRGSLQVTGTADVNSPAPGGLILNGLLVEGPVTVEPGNLGSIQLIHCTLQPSAGGLQVAAQVQAAHPALFAAVAVRRLAPLAVATAAGGITINKPVLNGGGGKGPPPPPPLRITTTDPLPGATAGTAYAATLAATGGTGGFSWSPGALPAGLTLAKTGILSGTPQAAGSFSISVTVNDSSGTVASKTFALPVAAAVAISTASPLPPANVSAGYSQTLAATGGSGVYSWTITGQPAWLTLSSAGVLTGTPPATGNVTFSITVTDSAHATRTAAFTLTVLPPPLVITTAQLPAAATGVAYSQTLTATGGQQPFTWGVSSGALPPGVTLSSATLSGQPTAAGSFSFTVKLSDSGGSTPVTRALSITITSGLTIGTAPVLPPVTAGAAYSVTLAASGGVAPFTWSISAGALPAGLQMDATGKIAGTPTSSGAFSLTVKVADSASGSATQVFSLAVAAAPVISTATLAKATQGAAYSQPLAVSGGTSPLTFSVTTGALPANVSLDPATGSLTGNPAAPGSFSFTVQAKDSAAVAATRALALTVAPPLAIASAATLPGGTANVAYKVTLATSGGNGPFAWSVAEGSLPPGLSLSAAGLLSGTPSDGANSTFTAQVKDAAGASAAANFSLAIAPALTIATDGLPAGELNVAYTAALTAQGGTPPYAWSLAAGALPAALALAGAGSIQGTPSAPGVTSLTLQVTDSNAITATLAMQLAIAAAPAITTPAALPTAVAGSPFSTVLAANGGVAPLQWSVTAGALPPGLSLTPQGAFSGSAAAAGTSTFTATVTDAQGVSASRGFTLIVLDDNPVLAVTLNRSICGPLSLDASAQLWLVDSIVDAAGGIAISAPDADATIQSSTVAGAVGSSAASGVRSLQAGNSIFLAPVFVERRQTGCVRFCYVAPGSRTPRRYRSQPDLALKNLDAAGQAAVLARLVPAFTSLVFGRPGYAQLSRACAIEILAGAEDGSEMGAFDFLKQPQRQDNLSASLNEFLRFGLEAGIFFVT